MKKSTIVSRLALGTLLIALISCQSEPTDSKYGVFIADKASLHTMMKGKMGQEAMNKTIDNAIIEYKISGDSINGDSIIGLMFLGGQTTILRSKIEIRNDSMIVKSDNSEVYLIPNDDGIVYKNKNAEVGIQLIKTDQSELSLDTQKAMKN